MHTLHSASYGTPLPRARAAGCEVYGQGTTATRGWQNDPGGAVSDAAGGGAVSDAAGRLLHRIDLCKLHWTFQITTIICHKSADLSLHHGYGLPKI